jgi:hypothetical protein
MRMNMLNKFIYFFENVIFLIFIGFINLCNEILIKMKYEGGVGRTGRRVLFRTGFFLFFGIKEEIIPATMLVGKGHF